MTDKEIIEGLEDLHFASKTRGYEHDALLARAAITRIQGAGEQEKKAMLGAMLFYLDWKISPYKSPEQDVADCLAAYLNQPKTEDEDIEWDKLRDEWDELRREEERYENNDDI